MLLNFKIKNFRSIKDEVTLDLQATSDKTMAQDAVFELGKTSLVKCAGIYGPNASGKSNILKAFVVFRMMILESLLRSNIPMELPSQPFKLNEDTENNPSSFEITFLLDQKIFSYGFAIDKKQIAEEWLRQKNKILFQRKENEIIPDKTFEEASPELIKQTTERVLFLSLLSAHNGPIAKKIVVDFIQKVNCLSGIDKNSIINYAFSQFLSNPTIQEKMKEFICKADFGITDIKASERMISAAEIKNMPDKFKELLFKEDSKIAGKSLKFLHKKFSKQGKEIGATALDFFGEESEGTQQMFAFSPFIIDTLENGKTLFIDELNANLHPYLCQYLITIFNSAKMNPKNAQLIFVTHDISLLNEDFLRRDEIYFTEKNEHGETELFSLSDISERTGVNFAKRYLEGRYNALPYIADFENIKISK